jgi:phosphate transport system substrate-binding protein
MVTLASGCAVPAPDPGTSAGLSGSITIAGSTSVQPLSEELAAAFVAKHPGVRINVQGGGSSAGVKAAQTGVADIGASSRELKPEEKGLHETVIARDGIAIVVHPSNPVKDLTAAQVNGIFAGRIANWSALGGPNRAIVVVQREAGSGTRGAFEEMVMGKDKVVEGAIVQNSTGAVRTTVAGNQDAIGYVSLAGLSPEVKALTIEGTAATIANIVAGRYKIARPFLYLTAKEPTGLSRAFIEFILGPEGQSLVAKEGLVPVR